MGQKDMREKLLEDYEDVFSDIFNVLLFQDKLIQPEFLRSGSTESIYKSENNLYREQRRDILKEYLNSCLLEIGSLGIENQSVIDDYISVRIMGYDYAKYRSQIYRKSFPLLPIITIVLNFSDKPWTETTTLHSIMKIPREFKSFVQNYEVRVFDIAFLEDEVIERFTSDFKILSRFFKNKRLGKPTLTDDEPITHVNELMDFLRVFTNDIRYEAIKENLSVKGKEGAVTMCTVAQALEEKGFEKGIEQGKFIQLVDLVKNNALTIETAAQFADMPIDAFLIKMKDI